MNASPLRRVDWTRVGAKEEVKERKAIGIEIDERYCEIAAKRLAQEVLFWMTNRPVWSNDDGSWIITCGWCEGDGCSYCDHHGHWVVNGPATPLQMLEQKFTTQQRGVRELDADVMWSSGCAFLPECIPEAMRIIKGGRDARDGGI